MTAAAFVVEPAYLVMTLLVILMLRRKKSRDLVLLKYAVVVFFIGENACTLNYLAASNASVWLEFLHGLGMVGMFFFLFWGLILFFDERVIHYLDQERPCVFKRLCGHCWNLLAEFRIYPILGTLCFIATLYWTRKGRDHLSKTQLPFCLALGFTSYSLFRFGLRIW